MRRVYIITGANGHLGNTLIRILRKTEVEIRGKLRCFPQNTVRRERERERERTFITSMEMCGTQIR